MGIKETSANYNTTPIQFETRQGGEWGREGQHRPGLDVDTRQNKVINSLMKGLGNTLYFSCS